MELNYKDFEIVQKLICIKLTTDSYNDDERYINRFDIKVE